ncbi:sugar ABC transporter permease [Fictibacillus enclensis]|uniref:carbohydrate ABC transporter permease n=1 Tax=Fictibacillus enclensis TaxID=1017270 RepID=UPI0025A0C463|nr:sugar ABC transporter permease [Fictibacillus enclensis]MDM5340484.1 sugar ABC transporter permease [Fictibacillus enclensis]
MKTIKSTKSDFKFTKIKRPKSDIKLAMALLFPSIFLVLLLVAYPMLSNIQISFFDQPVNPRLSATFVGLKNYTDILTDAEFFKSLGVTLLYMILAVSGSTALGLGVAIFFNRPFKFRKIARSLIILSYVTPSISLVFAWKYMFNNGYGVVNYLGGDVLHLFDKAPLWFDNPVSSFVLVVLFAIWRYFPYAFISFLAILQTIDSSLYEAAEIDGASAWDKFKIVTVPAIMPVLLTVVTLRSIWLFYMFTDVYLLTNKVNILGIYLYETAFAFNDLGKAASISVILFIILSIVIILARKRVKF